MAISETITGKHRIKQKNRYIIRNAAPPPLLTSNGNFQIFPNPTAEPAEPVVLDADDAAGDVEQRHEPLWQSRLDRQDGGV